jgi:hypothetical protein
MRAAVSMSRTSASRANGSSASVCFDRPLLLRADLGRELRTGVAVGRLAQRHVDRGVGLPAAGAKALVEALALDLVLDHHPPVRQVRVLLVEDPDEGVDVARRPSDVQLVVHPDARARVVEQQHSERMRLGALGRGAEQVSLHVKCALEVLSVSRRHRRRLRRRDG